MNNEYNGNFLNTNLHSHVKTKLCEDKLKIKLSCEDKCVLIIYNMYFCE